MAKADPMTGCRTIAVFTRSPRDEARAKRLPLKPAARLFREFLASWRAAADRVGARLLILAPPSSVPALDEQCRGWPASIESQRGSSFGQRVEDAVGRAFARGTGSLMLVAGDSPAPRQTVLERAFSALERDEPVVVVEPSLDGGVNLIGLSSPHPGLFGSLPWNTPELGAELESAAGACSLSIVRLPTRLDIDDLAAALRAAGLAARDPDWMRYGAILAALVATRPSSTPVAPVRSGPVDRVRTARAPPFLRVLS